MRGVYWWAWGAVAALGIAVGAPAQAPNLEYMDLVLKAVPNGPVALVNGSPIDAAEFKDLYMGEMLRLRQVNSKQQPGDDVRLGVALNCLRSLIEREVVYQEAKRRKTAVSDAKLTEAWSQELDKLKRAIAQGGNAAPSEAEVLQKAGTTREAALADLRRALLIEEVRTQIINEHNMTVSDDDVAKWYQQNKDRTRRPDMLHLKQIFIQADVANKAVPRGKPQQTADQRAQDAYNRIASGQSFEGVAKAVSDGRFKDEGGDWGMLPVADFPPFIVEAANKMKPGDISRPFQSEHGFHILKLVEVVAGEEIPFEKAAPDIRRMLLARKGGDAIHEFTSQTTRDPNKVQVFLDIEKQLRTRPELLDKFAQDFTPDQTAKAAVPQPKTKKP